MENIENKSLLSSLWQFLKRPRFDIPEIETSNIKKLWHIVQYWSLGIVVAFVASLISADFLEQGGFDDTQNLLQDFFSNNSVWIIVFMVFFFGPITEELIFRLGLRYSIYRFGFFLSIMIFFIFELSAEFVPLVSIFIDKSLGYLGLHLFLLVITVVVVLLGFLFSFLLKISNQSKRIEYLYKNYFPFLFYLSTLVFGFIHFFNFENFRELWMVVPFLVAPQIFLGAILGYIRMRYNLLWAIFYHFLHNTLVSLPLLFLTQVTSETLEALEQKEIDIGAIPTDQMLYMTIGAAISLLIFILLIVAFISLLINHKK